MAGRACRAGAGRGLAGVFRGLALLALAHAAAASTPPLIWADRNDRLFLTVPLPQMRDHAVALAPSGALAVNATSVGEAVALEIALAGPILPAESRWVAREHKLDFAIAKAERGRWAALLAAPYAGVVKTDWSKYVDLDDELDEEEKRAGVRGPAVEGSPGFARAVDDYWRRKRAERRDSGELPDLDTIAKLAEREHEREGGDFNAIVQRLWEGAKADLSVQRRVEEEEDRWADGEGGGGGGGEGGAKKPRRRKKKGGGARTRDEL